MSKRAVSQIQKHFQTHSIYKRSKRYFDIEKLNNLQKSQQMVRRKPLKSNETLDTRVDGSFVNSFDLYQQKRDYDISRLKKSYLEGDEYEHLQTQSTFDRTVKGVIDMDKMISRQTHKTRIGTYNQGQFSNFKINKYQSKVAIDFDKSLSRQKQNSLQKGKEYPLKNELKQTQKIHNNLVFDNSTFRCLFQYGKTLKFQIPKKQQSQPKPLSLNRVKHGFQMSSPFKSNGISSFYTTTGRDKPSQMDMKCLKSNQFYFQEDDLKLNDFSVIKRKQDMMNKRVEQIRKKKQFPEMRDEQCDLKYFRRISHLQK